MRTFLACWLVLFAVQSTEVLALVAPDGCFEAAEGTDGDDACPDQGCTRCLCSARITAPLTTTIAVSFERPSAVAPPAFVAPATTDSPHQIFHVPKSL